MNLYKLWVVNTLLELIFMEKINLIKNNFNQLKLGQTLSFDQFYALTELCVSTGTTTGKQPTTSRIDATKLNLQRMNRLIKTTQLLPIWDDLDPASTEKLRWIILSEAWCGDAAQIVPVLHKIADKLHIRLDLILRDEHPDIAEKYLFNGTNSIPRLICFDIETGDELGVWGPRPREAQEIVENAKLKGIPHDEWVIYVQNWYNQNKTVSLQNELFSFVSNCLS